MNCFSISALCTREAEFRVEGKVLLCSACYLAWLRVHLQLATATPILKEDMLITMLPVPNTNREFLDLYLELTCPPRSR